MSQSLKLEQYQELVNRNINFVVNKKEVSEVRWSSVAQAKELIEESPDTATDGLNEIIKHFY